MVLRCSDFAKGSKCVAGYVFRSCFFIIFSMEF